MEYLVATHYNYFTKRAKMNHATQELESVCGCEELFASEEQGVCEHNSKAAKGWGDLKHRGAFQESMLFLLKADFLWRISPPQIEFSSQPIMYNRTVVHNDLSANLSERH